MIWNVFDYFTITNLFYLLVVFCGWTVGSIPYKIYQSNRSIMNELLAVKMMVYTNSLDERRREIMDGIMEIVEKHSE